MDPGGDYHVESPQQGECVAAQETLLKLLAPNASA
jgi:hypothetical protein